MGLVCAPSLELPVLALPFRSAPPLVVPRASRVRIVVRRHVVGLAATASESGWMNASEWCFFACSGAPNKRELPREPCFGASMNACAKTAVSLKALKA